MLWGMEIRRDLGIWQIGGLCFKFTMGGVYSCRQKSAYSKGTASAET